MKKIVATFALTLAASTTQAALIQYTFTGLHSSEYIDNFPDQTPISTSDYLFADGTPVNVSFTFDNAAMAIANDLPNTGGAFALMSIYFGSFSNLSGVVAGHTFYSPYGITLVGNTNIGEDGIADGIINIADNNILPGSIQGFNMDEETLTSAQIYYVGGIDMLNDQSLPLSLYPSQGDTLGMTLTFIDENFERRNVIFTNGQLCAVSEVPVPAAAWLMGSSLLGLANFKRRRKA